MWSDQLMKMLVKPQRVIPTGNIIAPSVQDSKDAAPQEAKSSNQSSAKVVTPSDMFSQGQSHQMTNKIGEKTSSGTSSELLTKSATDHQLSQFQSQGQRNEGRLPANHQMNPQNPINDFAVMDQNNGMSPLQPSGWVPQSSHVQTQQIDPFQVESASANALLHYSGLIEFGSYPPMSSSPSGSFRNPGSLSTIKKSDQSSTSSDTAYPVMPSSLSQEVWDPPHFNNAKCVSPEANLPSLLPHQDMPNFQYGSSGLKDLSSDQNNNQSDIYSCLNLDGSNSGSTVIDPSSVSSVVLEEFCPLKNVGFQSPSDYLVGNYCSNQDVQSQITSASLADSHNFSLQEYADNSGGASSSNVEFDDKKILQHSSWQQVTAPRFRTYTKVIDFCNNYYTLLPTYLLYLVKCSDEIYIYIYRQIQKAGSVGRSIDVSSFKNYDELRSEIERMFGLEGLLNDLGSGWKLVYVDFENDVLLVGDDPWE